MQSKLGKRQNIGLVEKKLGGGKEEKNQRKRTSGGISQILTLPINSPLSS
jgi:hypothetical protein